MVSPAEQQERAAIRFRFGLFEADPNSGELRKAGIRIRIQGQPFRVLTYLLERPGQVVSREELHRHFWGADTTVDLERSLATAIHKIRECLDDSVVNPRFIETLARSGYRFIAPVTVVDAPEPQESGAEESHPSPAHETEPQTSSHPEPPASLTYRIGQGRFWAAIALVGTLAAVGAYLAERRAGAHPAIPSRVTQVTLSGRVSPDNPLFENFAGMATDGSRIYFPQIEDGRSALAQVLIPDDETSTLPLPEELPAPTIDDLSPDGSRLLLRNHLNTEPEQPLWIASTIGGMAHRIPGISAHDATWMPDGQRIVYATGNNLYIVRDDGTENRKFVTLPGRAFRVRWSPDMSHLRLTLVNDETRTSRLWEVSADGSGLHMLLGNWKDDSDDSSIQECCGSWTKDGRYYVFQSTGTGGSNIWAIPEHGGFFGGATNPIPITNGPLSYLAPITSPDGHRIFFVGLDAKSELMRLERQSGALVPYSGSLRNARRVEFSRDGEWVAWIRQADGSLWRSRSDGSEPLPLTSRSMEVFRMRWSPDSHQLALMGRQTGQPWKLYIVDAVSGHMETVLNEDHSEADPDWSPDGKMLAFGRTPDLMAEASQPEGHLPRRSGDEAGHKAARVRRAIQPTLVDKRKVHCGAFS